ncbi:MAG: zinc ribbon domain-containing protein [Acidobacteria bacterium]|nr:zinc ribbon domain-containing protein [Acidobacteriota bacterium]
MPIYEYLCKDCGSKFEKLVRRAGDSVECPSCGKSDLSQQLSTFAAHANGKPQGAPKGMCPSGGMCPTPGACGLN